MSSDNDGPSPAKKSVEQLLSDGKKGKCFNYKLVSVETNKKFRLQRRIYNLRFENLNECEDPQNELVKGLTWLVDSISFQDKDITKLGLILESPLLEYEAAIPFTDVAQDLPQLFGNMFYKMQQSAKLAPVFDAPFNVSIITYKKTVGRGRDPLMGRINIDNMLDIDFGDKYCLFHSIIAAISLATSFSIEKLKKVHTRMYNNPQKYKDQLCFQAQDLIQSCNINPNLDGYTLKHVEIVQAYLKEKFGDMFCILVFSTSNFTKPIFKGNVENPDFYLSLFWYNEHFYVIKNLGKFCSGKNKHFHYCPPCGKVFRKVAEHTNACPRRCSYCLTYGKNSPCKLETPKQCQKCSRTYPNIKCFNKHLHYVCGRFIFCKECGCTYRYDKKHKHLCGENFCRKCFTYHLKKDHCFIKPIKLSQEEEYRIVVFDFETTQDTIVQEGVFEHEVNYIVAYVFCTNCIKDENFLEDKNCKICGTKKKHFFSGIDDPECLYNFVKWLIYDLNNKYKSKAISHFGGRFDMIFVLKKLFNLNLNPRCVKNGNKFYEIHIESGDGICETTFLDSYNFMPLPLSSLVKTFNLQIQEKMFFPHAWNRKCNYNVYLQNLPPKNDYFYRSFTKSKQALFDEWYTKEYNTPFFLPAKLKEYCANDVDILANAVKSFRDIFLDVAQIDPFTVACTIAGTVMKLYRAYFLPEKTLAIVPENGYQRHSKASTIALKYLTWLAHKTGKNIQHRNTSKGEAKLGPYLVDGFIEEDKHVIEIFGCAWHGHLQHFSSDTWLPTHRTAGAEFDRTMTRINKIKDMGYTVDIHWECDIMEELKTNKEMSDFFEGDECILGGPINPKDAYFGGRCNPHKIHCQKTEGRTIHYVDFTSLYPSTNLTSYPVAIPEIIDIPFIDQNILWTKPSDNPYKGILKVFIIPPHCLLAPVVPLRVDDYLIFPLCKTCAKTNAGLWGCKHDNLKRGWVATLTHLELNLALEKGYKITKLFSVYNFHDWSDNLFRDFVKKFLLLKTQADGWPPNVKTHEDKLAYIKEYKKLFGIDIEYDKVNRNEGLRYISKLALNALWGKFSMSNTLSKCLVSHDPLEIDNIINSDCYIVKSIDLLNENQVMIVYDTKTSFVVENDSSNVIVSLWTSSTARVTLYRSMDKVINTPECFLNYTDTDSLIYEAPEHIQVLPIGNFLGDLTNEIKPHEIIIEVIVGGSKQYATAILNTITNEMTYNLKLRGITLNAETSTKLHYEKFKQMVLDGAKKEIVDLKYTRIAPSRLGHVYSKTMMKQYKVVYKKGNIGPDLIVYPFGYRK